MGFRPREVLPPTARNRLCRVRHRSCEHPFESLPKKQQKLLLYGITEGERVEVKFRNRYGRTRTYSAKYEGVIPYLKRRHGEAESDSARDAIEGYMRLVPCGVCNGARLNPLALAVTIDELNIDELCSMSIQEAAERLVDLHMDDRQALIAERILKEINVRLQFLCDVGLEYLSLSPLRCDALGWRGPAHSSGVTDRLRARRSALCARRAVDRPAPARQPQADRDPGTVA
ncbi:MAG: hypothetical protein V9E94_12295 [Microthrixaceae bacterium]